MIVELLRVQVPTSDHQFGILRVNGKLACLTLERPWLNNVPNVSCIPEGTYTCERTTNRQTTGGMKIPVTYEIKNVPNRSGILFHTGNHPRDSRGCVLTGLGIDAEGHDIIINSSRAGFERFLKATQNIKRFELTVSFI